MAASSCGSVSLLAYPGPRRAWLSLRWVRACAGVLWKVHLPPPPPSLMFLGISIPSSLPVFWSRSFQLGHTLFPAEASATHRWKTLCPWRGHVGGVLFVFLQETSEMVSCVGDSLVRKLCVGVPMWGTHACVWRPPQLFETVPLTELGTISFSQTGYPASPRVLLPWSCWG